MLASAQCWLSATPALPAHPQGEPSGCQRKASGRTRGAQAGGPRKGAGTGRVRQRRESSGLEAGSLYPRAGMDFGFGNAPGHSGAVWGWIPTPWRSRFLRGIGLVFKAKAEHEKSQSPGQKAENHAVSEEGTWPSARFCLDPALQGDKCFSPPCLQSFSEESKLSQEERRGTQYFLRMSQVQDHQCGAAFRSRAVLTSVTSALRPSQTGLPYPATPSSSEATG